MQRKAIEVSADLVCNLDGKQILIQSLGTHTVLSVPDLATGLLLLQLGSPRGSYFKALHQVKLFLDLISHTVELRVRGSSLAVIGFGVGNPGWRLLGLPKLKIKPIPLISLIFSRHYL